MDEEYEEYEEEYSDGGRRWRILIVILAALLIVAATILVFLLLRKPSEPPGPMGYAQGVTVETGVTVVDEVSLQKAAAGMLSGSESPGISLAYKNSAKSADGRNFTCYIANDEENRYDLYIAVYPDGACQEELFRSARLQPGEAVEHLELSRKLEKGSHELTVAFIQLEDASETVHAQTLVTMNFKVS